MVENQNQQNTVVNETSPLKGIEEDYIEQIKNLKQNSVPKEAFEELEAEHKRLIGELVNGQGPVEEVEVMPDIQKMRAELFDPEKQYSNLEYCIRALDLRNAIIKSGGQDPFLPSGPNISPTNADMESAQRVADVLEQCIAAADGDNGIFTAALQSRMVEPLMPKKRK